MSNLGFHKYIESIGCSVDVTQVGDRYVLEQMLKSGSVIGGEQSGHIIFLNHSTTGDRNPLLSSGHSCCLGIGEETFRNCQTR